MTRSAWALAFTVALFGPVALRAFSAEEQGLAKEIITVTGLLALSLLVCSVILPSRVRSITQAFGIESVLSGHAFLGACTGVASLAHVSAVIVADPASVGLLDPFTGPGRSMAGLISTLAVVYTVIASAFRDKGDYERWRWAHVALALISLLGAAVHVWLIGHLIHDVAMASLMALMALSVFAVLLNRWLVQPMSNDGEFIVKRVEKPAPDVSTITLRPRSKHAPWKFKAGQFAWMRLERGPLGEEHPFTISSSEQDGLAPQFTIRHAGDWTTGPLARLRVGDRVWLSGPHGRMTPETTSAGFVMIAAGVGMTPMISILRTLANARDPRPIVAFICDRPGESLFAEEMEALTRVLRLHVQRVAGRRITPEVLDEQLPHSPFVREQLEYLVCGNPRLVHDSKQALHDIHIPENRIKSELFNA
jgi:predicted ferric reductase